MFRTFAVVRTVRVNELKKEVRTNTDGTQFETKTLYFTVASDRNYYVEKVVNGQKVKVRPSDFMFCKATGNVAEVIYKNCNYKTEDGKLISRRLELFGHIEMYKAKKQEKQEKKFVFNGQTLKGEFTFEYEVDQPIFVIEEVQFLDSNPVKNEDTVVTVDNNDIPTVTAVQEVVEQNNTQNIVNQQQTQSETYNVNDVLQLNKNIQNTTNTIANTVTNVNQNTENINTVQEANNNVSNNAQLFESLNTSDLFNNISNCPF